jgi:transposase
MSLGRPTKPLYVTAEEKQKQLLLLARRPKSSQAMARRARIVLGCDEGRSNTAVANRLHITGATVCKWRERFRVGRLEGLLDEPRPGAPRAITDAQVEAAVITRTLESMPANSAHWSSRLMAQKTGLSKTAIVRIWRAFGLQPHRARELQVLQRSSLGRSCVAMVECSALARGSHLELQSLQNVPYGMLRDLLFSITFP